MDDALIGSGLTSTRPTTVAITGVIGFVGCSLVRYHLEKNRDVRVFGGKQAPDSPDLLGAKQFQGCIELAIPTAFLAGIDTLYRLVADMREPSKEAVNVYGTSTLLFLRDHAGGFNSAALKSMAALLQKQLLQCLPTGINVRNLLHISLLRKLTRTRHWSTPSFDHLMSSELR
jgi:hypothetical protein